MISGVAHLLENLGRLTIESDVAAEAGVLRGANLLRDGWVSNIEAEGLVLTGTYRDSIAVESSLGLEGPEATVYSDVPYASILEHGDSRQGAHPVAQRALDEHSDEAIASVGTLIAAALL